MLRDLHVIRHPLMQHKLTLLRDKELSTRGFRQLTHEISALLAYEVMRDAPTRPVPENPAGAVGVNVALPTLPARDASDSPAREFAVAPGTMRTSPG